MLCDRESFAQLGLAGCLGYFRKNRLLTRAVRKSADVSSIAYRGATVRERSFAPRSRLTGEQPSPDSA
jgi:hypothetical protein